MTSLHRAHRHLARPTDVTSWRHLRHLLGWEKRRVLEIAETAGRHYSPFDIREVGSDKWRHIDNPRSASELRQLQAAIQKRILRRVSCLPEFVVGGVTGKSIRDNASIHCRAPVVATIDLRNCFPSIDDKAVYRALRSELGYGCDIAHALTKVTTFQHRVPQGAPTSTMIANLALLPLHRELAALAERAGLAYSAWVDDFIFSGQNAEYQIEPAIRIIQSHGYAISARKTSVMRGWREPQKVTGAIVNTAVSAGRERIRDIEAEILCMADRGTASPRELRAIQSKIAFVAGLRPTQGRRLTELLERVAIPTGHEDAARNRVEVRPCLQAKRHIRRRRNCAA